MTETPSEVLVAPTGRVTPAPGGPLVEQVGWGVARQVARVLAPLVGDPPPTLLEDVVRLAEAPGHLAYAVFEGRTALALALVALPAPTTDGPGEAGEAGDRASYLGDVVVPGAAPGTRQALVVRALHDVAHAGVGWLAATGAAADLRPLGFC